jgi:preprotein translocase SecE subunit
MKTFFTGLGSEFQKIVWPKTGEALGHAILVIGVAVVVGYYIGAFDALFAMLLKLIIG